MKEGQWEKGKEWRGGRAKRRTEKRQGMEAVTERKEEKPKRGEERGRDCSLRDRGRKVENERETRNSQRE